MTSRNDSLLKISSDPVGKEKKEIHSHNHKNRDRGQLIQEIEALTRQCNELKSAVEARKHELEALWIQKWAMESAEYPISLLDMDGRVSYVNPAFLSVFRFVYADQVLGKSALDFFHDADAARILLDDLAQKGVWRGEIVSKRRDRSLFDAEISAHMIADSNGNRICMMLSMLDITERKNAEKALRNSESRYSGLFRNSPVPLFEEDLSAIRRELETIKSRSIKDLRGYLRENPDFVKRVAGLVLVKDVNDAAIKMFGARDKRELLGNLDKILALDLDRLFVEEMIAVDKGESEFRGDGINQTLDGRPIHVLLNLVIPPGNEGIHNVLVSLQDITRRKEMERELAGSQRLLADIIDFLPDPTLAINTEGQVIIWNRAMEEMTGIPAKDMLGKGNYEYALPFYGIREPLLADLFLNPDPEIEKKYKIIRREKDVLFAEASCRIKGKMMQLWVKVSPFYNFQQQIIGVIESLRDITEHRHAELALKQSETKYRELVENANSIILRCDTAGFITFFNEFAQRFFGYRNSKILGKNIIGTIMPETDSHGNDMGYILDQIQNHGDFSSFETEGLHRNSEEKFWVSWTTRTICDAAGKLCEILCIGNDITQLQRSKEQIRTLTQRLISAQESERRQIALYLHDHVAQNLSTVNIGCRLLFDQCPEAPEAIRHNSNELSRMLEASIRDIRNLSYDLRPASLDQLGLVRTVYEYCKSFSERHPIAVDFASAGLDESRLDAAVEINLYRVIQESLNNIALHSEATHVTIRLVRSYPNIILRIIDNGKGFDEKTQMIASMKAKRMGLSNMEERIHLLNGVFKINSRPQEGTKILIQVPVKER